MNWPDWKKTDWSPKDYWHIGPVYVRKYLLLALLSAGSLLVLGLFGLPHLFTTPASAVPPVYRYDDPALQMVSGVVQITDSSGRVRYVGEVQQGICTGKGKVYDDDGQLCYDGPLVDGVYEGGNAKVYADGILVYTGDMADNLYEGQGRRTDPDTGVVSVGAFSRGMLEGQGKEYDAKGTLLREGVFAHDLLNGAGKEYSTSGSLLREGTFEEGLLHGEGKAYTLDGILLYEGQFQRGTYHGNGKLYDPVHQAVCYEGAFVGGNAIGTGKIYHPSGQLLYEGETYDARPRADAFLSLSLEELEQSFTQHWQAYIWGSTTAFVYPYFQLMFLTESPVTFVSSSGEAVLQPLGDGSSNSEEAVPRRSVEGVCDDEILSPETDKASVIITQVLSYGQALPGVPQPELEQARSNHEAGWREWFSDYALGCGSSAAVTQTGQFVFRFSEFSLPEKVEETLAMNDLIETTTAWKTGKEETIWYQTARWREPS